MPLFLLGELLAALLLGVKLGKRGLVGGKAVFSLVVCLVERANLLLKQLGVAGVELQRLVDALEVALRSP